MNLAQLIDFALTKSRFLSVADYASFCEKYLEYIHSNIVIYVQICRRILC